VNTGRIVVHTLAMTAAVITAVWILVAKSGPFSITAAFFMACLAWLCSLVLFAAAATLISAIAEKALDVLERWAFWAE